MRWYSNSVDCKQYVTDGLPMALLIVARKKGPMLIYITYLGLSQSRFLVVSPPPHEWEHSLQSPHGPKPPSTASGPSLPYGTQLPRRHHWEWVTNKHEQKQRKNIEGALKHEKSFKRKAEQSFHKPSKRLKARRTRITQNPKGGLHRTHAQKPISPGQESGKHTSLFRHYGNRENTSYKL